MTAPARPRRADAVRNAERVLEAARQVFAERGLEAGIDEVAARAGVGKATVYRSWPTKEALVASVVGARLDWFTALALEAAQAADPWLAYVELLHVAADSAAGNAMLQAGLAEAPECAGLHAKRAVLAEALQALLDAGKAQGRVRADLSAREVPVLLSGAFRVLRDEGDHDPATWRRCADLVAGASRP